jgi:hypothetical protein
LSFHGVLYVSEHGRQVIARASYINRPFKSFAVIRF